MALPGGVHNAAGSKSPGGTDYNKINPTDSPRTVEIKTRRGYSALNPPEL